MMRLARETSVLVVVDVQEKLCAAMPEATMKTLIANSELLLDAAALLGVDVIASEQYPKGLGPTIEPLRSKLAAKQITPHAKMDFSACADLRFARALESLGKKAAIVIGMEAHVCVFQTVRDLVSRGYEVHVVADAVSSRTEENRIGGIKLCERAGAIANGTESILFDWLGRAGSPEFKEISKRIR